MGLLTSLLTGTSISAGTPGPADDYWYSGGAGGPSLSGVAVTPDTAPKLSAYYRGVDLIARATAAVPWVINRYLPKDQGEERAKDHPRYRMLSRRPNLWQTSAEFRYLGMWRVMNRGNFYARRDQIRGDEVLTPMDPDRMDVKLLSTGTRGYRFRPPTGQPEAYRQEEMFHVMGAPDAEGKMGLSVIERARVALGRSLAQQEYGARWFAQNGTPAFALRHPGKLPDKARQNIEQAMDARAAGLANAHKTLVLEEDMKIDKIGLSMRDSQFVELEQFGVVDVCRWLGVQPHKVYELSRATFSNIEHQAIEFLTDTMDPWFVFWEQAAERDLLDNDEDYTVKLIREGMLRGDILSRAQAYAQFIQNGVMAENEARQREGLPKFPGLDRPSRSANQGPSGGGGAPAGGGRDGAGIPTPQPPDDGNPDQPAALATARAEGIRIGEIRTTAASLIRKETAALRTALKRGERGLAERVTTFYGEHAEALTTRLHLDVAAARGYCAEHCAAFLADDQVLEAWERDAAAALAELALTPMTAKEA